MTKTAEILATPYTATIISSQRYIDQDIVDAKIEDGDYRVTVTQEIVCGDDTYRILIDGHHRMEAAKQAGAEIEWTEIEIMLYDGVQVTEDQLDDLLAEHYMDADWYNVATGANIW